MPEPRAVTLSVRLYRAMLLAYPAGFRGDYGEDMAQVFRDCCLRAARQAGPANLLVLWAHTFLDYLFTVVGEHANRGAIMTRTKWIKLSGWALAFGPVSLLLSGLANLRPDYDPVYGPYNAAAWPIDPYINLAEKVLLLLGVACITIGAVGLYARYSQAAGTAGRSVLWISIAAGLVSLVGGAGLWVTDSDPWWSFFFVGFLVMMLGFAAFSTVCLQKKLLPRWNAAGLVAGVPYPLLAFGLLPDPYLYLGCAALVTGCALLGYRLQSGLPADHPVALTA